MKQAGLVLFWSVLAAAFIGPGTVTTAATAGASYGYELLWALSFSTLACLLLQEMSARSRLVTGLSLGDRIRMVYPSRWVRGLIAAAIGLGGIAFEAGNLLGALAGIELLLPETGPWFRPVTICCLVIAAALVLLQRNANAIAKVLGGGVLLMGLGFLIVALLQNPEPTALLHGAVIPSFPADGGWVILGLIGTTIVPYNLFLGGSIGGGQSIADMRFGMTVAVMLGGIISMAVLVAAIGVEGDFSFQALANIVENKLGARWIVGLGLTVAGFTSAVTAPWASALALSSLFPAPNSSNTRFQIIWAIVLLAGLVFGLSGLKPVPVIIMAQALNGLVLPLITYFLLLMMNKEMASHQNSPIANLLGLLVLGVTTLIGLIQLTRVFASITGLDLLPIEELLPWYLLLIAGLLAVVAHKIRVSRR
ncbi:MAG: Nramp family divalent metal transporter [Bacteroidia bacterium]|nr:Nramp family divalent metal transporter [Bacteroidia bacterium]